MWDSSRPPSIAIDGLVDNRDTHSSNENGPTFLVDLPEPGTIVTQIKMYPKQTMSFGKYTGMKIKVDDTYCDPTSRTASHVSQNKASGIIWNCDNLAGSTITIENGNTHIHITEIEAFGWPPID